MYQFYMFYALLDRLVEVLRRSSELAEKADRERQQEELKLKEKVWKATKVVLQRRHGTGANPSGQYAPAHATDVRQLDDSGTVVLEQENSLQLPANPIALPAAPEQPIVAPDVQNVVFPEITFPDIIFPAVPNTPLTRREMERS
uniref:Uncharacterized protein n=1 Tax=Ditylenchus dipsaci TaxID=166011 RepID=A0A915EHC5_9BILA